VSANELARLTAVIDGFSSGQYVNGREKQIRDQGSPNHANIQG
jgi:hypothetical protein